MKATHIGECQICGSKQMLPGGVLSKHGYTRKWGFFNGICTGAEHQPFELSKDRIADAVAAMRLTIAAVEREIEDLRNPGALVNAESEAYVHTCGLMGYQWEKLPVRLASITYAAGTPDAFTRVYVEYKTTLHPSYTGQTVEKWHRVQTYGEEGKNTTLNQWVTWLNMKYAVQHLAKLNSQRKVWVKWQEDRLKNWAPKPLTPRVTK